MIIGFRMLCIVGLSFIVILIGILNNIVVNSVSIMCVRLVVRCCYSVVFIKFCGLVMVSSFFSICCGGGKNSGLISCSVVIVYYMVSKIVNVLMFKVIWCESG